MSVSSSATVLAEITLLNDLQLNDLQQETSFQITKLPIRIGREQAANDFVLSYSSISRSHAEIDRENGIWSIKNLTVNRNVPNKVAVNGQEVWQQSLHNNDVIGLGTEVKLRFATYTEEEPYNINRDITHIYSNPPSLVTSPSVVEKKNVGVGPFNNFEHPAWSVVGTLTGIAGLVVLIEQSISAPQNVQFFTGIVTAIVCIVILGFEQVRSLPASQQKRVAAIPPIVNVPVKRNVQRWFLRTIVINIFLLVAFAIITDLFYSSNTGSFAHEWEIIVFILGQLIAFISFLVTISNLMMKKMLKRGRVLWMSGAVFLLACLLFVFGAYINNPGIWLGAAVIDIECIVVFVITLIIALVLRATGE